MRAEELLIREFDRLSEAPGAVEKLRQFVLDLAVRGRVIEPELTAPPPSGLKFENPDHQDAPFSVPENWRWCTVRSLGQMKGGGTPSKARADFWNGSIPWISPKDMKVDYIESASLMIGESALAESSVTLLPPSTLLFVVRGMILAHSFPVALTRVATTINQDMKAIVLSCPEYGEYLLHALKGLKHLMLKRVQRSSHGTCRIEGHDYGDFLVPVPPLQEQRRIVRRIHELLPLCDRLKAAQAERERQRNGATVRLASSLTNSLDTSVTANALLRFTSHLGQISSFTAAVLELGVTGRLAVCSPVGKPNLPSERVPSTAPRDSGDDPALPALPPNWRWSTIGDVAACVPNAITDGPFGAQLKTEHYVNTPGYRVVRLQNIAAGQFRNEKHSYISREHFERLTKHHVFSGDLIVAGLVDPSVRCCQLPADIGPAVVKADCYRFRVGGGASARFLMHYLNSPVCQRLAAEHHHGMTLLRLGLGNFRRLPVPLPPLAEQKSIVETIDRLLRVSSSLSDALTHEAFRQARALEVSLRSVLDVSSVRTESAPRHV